MTYRELLQDLQNLPDERLDDTATAYDPYQEEFIPIAHTYEADEENTDQLDEGHLYLVLKA